MEGSKLQFNGRTEGFFIGRFVFESESDVNVPRESVRYHNFITAIFVRIFGSGIIDIKTERGTIIHLNKGSVEKLVNKSSKTDDHDLPDYVQNLKNLLASSPQKPSSSAQRTPPKMFTDANELYQKGQSYFNNQNTEKTDVKVQTEEKRAKLEKYKETITTFLEKEKEKFRTIEEDFLKLEFTKEDAKQNIQSFIRKLPKCESFPPFNDDWQNTDFSEEAKNFWLDNKSKHLKIGQLEIDTHLKLNALFGAATALEANLTTMAKQQAEKYPNDPMFKKLFKLFNTPL